MLGFLPSSGFQRYTLNSRVSVAPAGFGQALPPVIFEFFGSANSAILLTFRHSGMVRRTRPGISRFRVRCSASPRNDTCGFAQYTRAFGGMYWTSFVIV